MGSAQLIVCIFIGIFIIMRPTSGLTCYQDDPGRGVTKVSDPNFEYCLLFPRLAFDSNGEVRRSGVAGMEYCSDDTPLSSILDVKRLNYKVLAMCIYEMYDWPRALHPTLKFGTLTPSKPDFMLRCV